MNANYPGAFLDQMRALLGDQYPSFERALGEPACPALRLNPARAGAEALLGDIAKGVVPWEPDGRYVRPGFRPGDDPLHAAGGYYMQDASAMAPARVLGARPGEAVLDLCAAPGGKAGQLAAMLRGRGILVANEPDAARAKALCGNLERLGTDNAAVISAYPEALAARWPERFDAVLADAPCSGEGMFRRDEAARQAWSPECVAGCAARQRPILLAAARMVAPGGRLVYSTCTFNRAENEDNVAWLLRERPDFCAVDFELPGVGASENGCIRLWPHRVRGEGHFVALLHRTGTREPAAVAQARSDRAAVAAFDLLREAVPGPWHERYRGWSLTLRGDILWAAPPELPDLGGLRVLRAGLMLARVGRGHVRPEHALAMAVPPAAVASRAEVTAAQYLCGETLPGDLRGWALATWRGLGLGWVKGADGWLKNHLPKGLRRR